MRFAWSKVLPLCAAALVTGSGIARAETLAPGTVELSPMFDFSHSGLSMGGSNILSASDVSLNVGFGYCVTSLFEPTGAVVLNYASVKIPSSMTGSVTSSSVSATAVGLDAGLMVNFPSSDSIIPFARAEIGFLSYSGDGYSGAQTTLIAPILSLGTKWMVGRSAAVNIAISYDHESNAGGGSDVTANDFSVGVGVSVFPGRR